MGQVKILRSESKLSENSRMQDCLIRTTVQVKNFMEAYEKKGNAFELSLAKKKKLFFMNAKLSPPNMMTFNFSFLGILFHIALYKYLITSFRKVLRCVWDILNELQACSCASTWSICNPWARDPMTSPRLSFLIGGNGTVTLWAFCMVRYRGYFLNRGSLLKRTQTTHYYNGNPSKLTRQFVVLLIPNLYG